MSEGTTPGEQAWIDTQNDQIPEITSYSAGSIVDTVIGSKTKVRILDFLITEQGDGVLVKTICEQTGISTTSFYENIHTLEEYNLVKSWDGDGYAQLYAINTDSEAAKKFAEFTWTLCSEYEDFPDYAKGESDE